jgi:hypothetical protein
MFSFPKIRQFKDVIREVKARMTYKGRDEDGMPIYDSNAVLPALRFWGTVKLHGTNSSVVIRPDGIIQAQSRKRVLTIDSDNYGFANFVHDEIGHQMWLEIAEYLREKFSIDHDKTIVIYGEWAGSGIQSGVAISKVERAFHIFAVRAIAGKEAEDDEKEWIEVGPGTKLHDFHDRINDITTYTVYTVVVDFESPGSIINDLAELTNEVEQECPAGKFLGVNGIGEGIVWRCYAPGYTSSRFWFKVKGKKHSASKVRTLAPVDVEKMASLEEFVERTVTEQRLLQGIEHLKEMNLELSRSSTGDFLRWVFRDIAEEEADTMEASALTLKDIGKPVSTKARKWLFAYLDKDLF